jgi:hypothetical protein
MQIVQLARGLGGRLRSLPTRRQRRSRSVAAAVGPMPKLTITALLALSLAAHGVSRWDPDPTHSTASGEPIGKPVGSGRLRPQPYGTERRTTSDPHYRCFARTATDVPETLRARRLRTASGWVPTSVRPCHWRARSRTSPGALTVMSGANVALRPGPAPVQVNAVAPASASHADNARSIPVTRSTVTRSIAEGQDRPHSPRALRWLGQ